MAVVACLGFISLSVPGMLQANEGGSNPGTKIFLERSINFFASLLPFLGLDKYSSSSTYRYYQDIKIDITGNSNSTKPPDDGD